MSVIVFFSIFICAAFLTAGINVLNAKIEYDDEKILCRSLKKQKTIYYKDIYFFGRKSGSSTGHSRVYYWILKTKNETIQINIPVSFQSQEFDEFVETIKAVNSNIIIKK